MYESARFSGLISMDRCSSSRRKSSAVFSSPCATQHNSFRAGAVTKNREISCVYVTFAQKRYVFLCIGGADRVLLSQDYPFVCRLLGHL